jgi:hypothetical protein
MSKQKGKRPMTNRLIYLMQLGSLALLWVFVGTICYWILNLIAMAWRLHDVPNASLSISLVAVSVFITIACVLTYVFVGIQRGQEEER